jgi:hypothetical protein
MNERYSETSVHYLTPAMAVMSVAELAPPTGGGRLKEKS